MRAELSLIRANFKFGFLNLDLFLAANSRLFANEMQIFH